MDRDMNSILAFVQNAIKNPIITSIINAAPVAPGQTVDVLVANTFKTAADRLKDGFQLSDVPPIFGSAVVDIMKVAEQLTGATGAQKRDFVTQVLIALYQFIDKGIDGTKNRIHIPWLPVTIENYIENKALPLVVRALIEAVIAVWKK